MVRIVVNRTLRKGMIQPYFWMMPELSEDFHFCWKVQSECDGRIMVDTTIDVGHMGEARPIFRATAEAAWDHWNVPRPGEFPMIEGSVDIIIPCWNNSRLTERLLETLKQTRRPHRFIFIDNGSEDDTGDMLQRHARDADIIITNEENLGYVKAINQGMEASDADFVLHLNNDTMLNVHDPPWLVRLISHFKDGVGAVGPTSNFVLGLQKNWFRGLPTHHETDLLSGFCIALSREAVEKVGVLDERFGMGGNDDLDYCLRLKEAGFKLAIARDVFLWHEGSASLKVYTEEKYEEVAGSENEFRLVERLDRETRAILVEKWGQEVVDGLFTRMVVELDMLKAKGEKVQ